MTRRPPAEATFADNELPHAKAAGTSCPLAATPATAGGTLRQLTRANDAGLRIAVVGCGYWGSKHVRVLHAADGVDEVILVDGREDRLQSLARNYRAAPAFSTLESA